MKWHPASEPPSDGREVLVALGKGFMIGRYDAAICRWRAGVRISPTHWRELPAAPGEPDAAEGLATALRLLLSGFDNEAQGSERFGGRYYRHLGTVTAREMESARAALSAWDASKARTGLTTRTTPPADSEPQ